MSLDLTSEEIVQLFDRVSITKILDRKQYFINNISERPTSLKVKVLGYWLKLIRG